jgi:hypothetical protein
MTGEREYSRNEEVMRISAASQLIKSPEMHE